MEDQTCFECLQRQIQDDFTSKLVFSHGISDSALPFGSRAVVQLENSTGEVSARFVLVRVPSHEDDCLAKYIDSFLGNTDGSSGKVNVPVSFHDKLDIGIFSQETIPSASLTSDGISKAISEAEAGSFTFQCSGKFSCLRMITALAPVAYFDIGSCSLVEDIASKLLSGAVEDHVLSSLNLLIEGKATGWESINFLGLVGIPSFADIYIPGCVRHPNVAPILGMLKTQGCINLFFPKAPYTLENILHYSPQALRSEWHIRFLIYQLLSALAYMHGLGVSHGNLCPSRVMLTRSCWSWLSMCDKLQLRVNLRSWHKEECPIISHSGIHCSIDDCPLRGSFADMKLSSSLDWHSDFMRWWKGELSNYEYLLLLNRLAGRRWGDHTFHPVMPWVIDFSVKPDENSDTGWRDLSKGKWRLAKGDEQLDFTYSTSEIPHHVSDECLSELAVCSYKARRLPLNILRMAVRSVYEPNEYPSNTQRLYQWTPDECIPEFYSDSRIFSSVHSGMNDLAVPSWANSPEEFIKLHRDALESN